ncbi:phosphoglycerate kinase [Candidatus Uhrbacteria bacterium]|nr:phosphoglycerate kinase [Candidatus Uhrbacteria bacterium]
MKSLPALNKKASLRGKKVLLRVDWNIPLHDVPTEGDLLKIERSAETIKWLKRQGAVTIVLTHLGRPKSKDDSLSTVRLLPFAEAYLEDPLMFCGEDIEAEEGLIAVKQCIDSTKNGGVVLLENVRFYAGEETNDKKLAALYASLADIFINDAFASCHRKHASVAAIAKLLPHYAGPALQEEVAAASKLLGKPKKPFVAVIGGAKLSTKLPVINSLLKKADHILIGGAMAHAFLKAKRVEVGKSYLEEGSVKLARKLIKNKRIHLPEDALAAKALKEGASPRRASIKDISKSEKIGDIGPITMQKWSALIKNAQTILWNGPVGITELPAFSHGSMVIGYAVASRSKGKAYGVVGGGDTIPVALATGMDEWFDHISTGGGALLEFIATGGKVPGLTSLLEKQPKAKKSVAKPRKPAKIAKATKVKITKPKSTSAKNPANKKTAKKKPAKK